MYLGLLLYFSCQQLKLWTKYNGPLIEEDTTGNSHPKTIIGNSDTKFGGYTSRGCGWNEVETKPNKCPMICCDVSYPVIACH